MFVLGCLLWSVPAFAQDDPACAAEIAFTNPKQVINPANVLYINLFSALSNPLSKCSNGQIQLTATFSDSEDNVICSGTISLLDQSSNILSTNLEIQAFHTLEFARLVSARRPPAKRLACLNTEGNAEVSGTQLAAAIFMRLRATILPSHGGIATTEIRMALTGQ